MCDHRASEREPDYRAIFDPVASAEAVDDYTVEITTSEFYLLLLNLATYIFPMDSEFYRANRTVTTKPKSLKRVTSLHATYQALARSSSLTVARVCRSSSHWASKAKGNVSEIVLTLIAENASRVAALLLAALTLSMPFR